MKKILNLLLIFVFVFLTISPVFAQSVDCDNCSTTTARPKQAEAVGAQIQEHQETLEELRIKVRERREVIQQQFKERQATMTARLIERRKERIRNFFSLLIRRFQAAIKRLGRLIERIESRLEKIEAGNEEIDTATIKEDLEEAKTKLADAEAAIEDAQASLEDILSAEDPKEAFADLRELVKGIKEQLREVHQILVKIIGEIRGLRVGQEEG